jgi:hypothetical protein
MFIPQNLQRKHAWAARLAAGPFPTRRAFPDALHCRKLVGPEQPSRRGDAAEHRSQQVAHERLRLGLCDGARRLQLRAHLVNPEK